MSKNQFAVLIISTGVIGIFLVISGTIIQYVASVQNNSGEGVRLAGFIFLLVMFLLEIKRRFQRKR